MSYFELKDNDVFVNTIEAYPDYRLYVHSGTLYLNDHQAVSGTYSDNILGVPEGYVSLFEYNVNRDTSDRIYPFVVKGGHKQSFKTVSKTQFNTEFGYGGDVITGSYNLSASISRETMTSPSRKLRALKSSLNHYSFWSQSFKFENYDNRSVTMINIPSIFYGSSIKKGTVTLKSFIGGTVVGEATDTNKRGELVHDGNIIGNVLYDEGIILLSGSETLGTFGPGPMDLRWIDFAYGIGDGEPISSVHLLSASFSLDFQGTSQLQNMTILAKAPEGMLNHSNNPTYIQKSGDSLLQIHTSSYEYIEKKRFVKNVVHSEQTDVEPLFNKETYISKICIYDKDRRLIGICKLATPIRKTEVKEYLFKMKIDL